MGGIRGQSFKRIGDLSGRIFNRDLAERDDKNPLGDWEDEVIDLWADWYANPENEEKHER